MSVVLRNTIHTHPLGQVIVAWSSSIAWLASETHRSSFLPSYQGLQMCLLTPGPDPHVHGNTLLAGIPLPGPLSS